MLDLLVGLILGGLVSTATSWLLLGQELATLKAEVTSLRRDVEKLERKIG